MRISDWSSDVCSSDLGGRAEIAGAEQSVRVLGNAQDAYALGQTQIAIRSGRTVRLSDIADVRDKYAEHRSVSLMNGRQVTSFSLEKAKGSSDVSVYDRSDERLVGQEWVVTLR